MDKAWRHEDSEVVTSDDGVWFSRFATETDKKLVFLIHKAFKEYQNSLVANKVKLPEIDEFVRFFETHADVNPNAIIKMKFKDTSTEIETSVLQLAVLAYLYNVADFLVSKGADPQFVFDGGKCVRDNETGKWNVRFAF
jgi:hypothetical protein